MAEFTHAGKIINYSVVISKLAKRISVRVSDNKVKLILPHKRYLASGERFIHERGAWILEHLAEYTDKQQYPLLHGQTIRILDEEFQIQHVPGTQNRVAELGGMLTVSTPQINSQAAQTAISKYLRKKYSPLILYRVKELADQHKFSYNKLSIRDQSSRWGSCSSQKSITFNWRLIFAPHEALDYVIIHELAHTIELNHSPQFWRIVRQIMPNYKQHKQWLDENRYMLHSF